MGARSSHLFLPDNFEFAACYRGTGFIPRMIDCPNDPFTPPKAPRQEKKDDPAPPPPDYGTTIVRFTIGSHYSHGRHMAGSLPSVAIFSEFGVRIGQTESHLDRTIQGSFKDVAIKHKREQENVRPSYVTLLAGERDVCIVGVGLVYPDGDKQFFTGSDLDFCKPNIVVSDSSTFVGPKAVQPKCFWLHGSKGDDRPAMHRLSMHLPDLVWTRARNEAYRENPKLACGPSPRLYPYWRPGREKDSIDQRIWIFNPPVQYNPQTGFDSNPSQQLDWIQRPRSQFDESDSQYWHRSKPRRLINVTEDGDSGVDSGFGFSDHIVSPPVPDQTDSGLHQRTQPPTLVISQSDLSAQHRCLWGAWNNTDVVSLSEKLYCDMQSRSLLPFCSGDMRQANCWNPETRMLQGSESIVGLMQNGIVISEFNATLGAGPRIDMPAWNITGPLFGFSYPSIHMVD